MYAHGHLFILQMATWVMDGLDSLRAQQVRQGFTPSSARHQVHCRWMGGAAASGSRRAIFTCQDLDCASMMFQVTCQWWATVPTDIDPRGWRGVSVDWAW